MYSIVFSHLVICFLSMASRQKPIWTSRLCPGPPVLPHPRQPQARRKVGKVQNEEQGKRDEKKMKMQTYLLILLQCKKKKKTGCLRTAMDCGFILDNLSCHARGTLSQLKVVSHESVESVLKRCRKSFGDSHASVGHVAMNCAQVWKSAAESMVLLSVTAYLVRCC